MRLFICIFILFACFELSAKESFCESNDYCQTIQDNIPKLDKSRGGYQECFTPIQDNLNILLSFLENKEYEKNNLNDIIYTCEAIQAITCWKSDDIKLMLGKVINDANDRIKKLSDKKKETKCDIESPNDDCDNDGVRNVMDCAPKDAMRKETIGDNCNDKNDDTKNDRIDANCKCVGMPIKTYNRTPDGWSLKNLWGFLLLFLLLTLLFFGVKFFRKKRGEDESQKNKLMMDLGELRRNNALLEREKKTLEEELSIIRQKNTELKNENVTLNKRITAITEQNMPEKQEDVRLAENPLSQPYLSSKKILSEGYLSSPTKGGDFKSSDISPSLGQYSYYNFIQHSENEAEFNLIDSIETQMNAIKSHPYVIAPVCEGINSRTSNVRKIQVVENGKLILKGNIWKVTKKCKIRYI